MVARRGIALITALFAVVLLFGFATALLAQVRGDLALTRDLDLRARSRALARSAVQAGLYELNRDPAWEAAHLNQPDTRMLDGHELRFWVEPTSNPGILRLRGQAKVGEESAENTMLVTKAGGPGGLLLETSNEIYQYGSDGGWTVLPPAPTRVKNPVGGPNGEVYAWSDNGTVHRYEPGTGLWSPLPSLATALPPPENGRPNVDEAPGGRIPPNADDGNTPRNENPPRAGDEGSSLRGLAVDGSGQLYALRNDQVYFLDGATWQSLPRPGGDSVRFLSVDDAGHVWVIQNKRTPLRYDPALERWQKTASRPDLAWEKDDGRLKVRKMQKAPELKSATVDPQGNLYLAGPSHDDIVTLYRFVPGESTGAELPGTYHLLATVPKVKMKKDDGQLKAVQDDDEYARKADNLVTDASGTLYFRLNRDDYDTLYQATIWGSQATYGTLPGVPKVKRRNGEQVEKPGEFMKDVKRLGGGRTPSSALPSYVPRYEE